MIFRQIIDNINIEIISEAQFKTAIIAYRHLSRYPCNEHHISIRANNWFCVVRKESWLALPLTRTELSLRATTHIRPTSYFEVTNFLTIFNHSKINIFLNFKMYSS